MKTWLALLVLTLSGRGTQLLVAAAFLLNIVCFLDLPESNRNLYKLLVQQALILCIATVDAKLDRNRPRAQVVDLRSRDGSGPSTGGEAAG